MALLLGAFAGVAQAPETLERSVAAKVTWHGGRED